MQLKDDKGRTVVAKQGIDYSPIVSFWAQDGLNLVQVDEAIISKGDDVLPSKEYVENKLLELNIVGFKNCDVKISDSRYAPIEVNNVNSSFSGWSSIGGGGRYQYFIGGDTVKEEEYKRFNDKLKELNSFNGLRYCTANLSSSCRLSYILSLDLIGEGKVITPESLSRGCAKGEFKPRFVTGDIVEVNIRGNKITGTVKGMTAKVSVMRQDGVRGSYPYDKVVKSFGVAYSDSIADELDKTLRDNFNSLLQNNRTYRAKTEVVSLSFPMFPDETCREQQREYEKIKACHCPVCGWMMACFGSKSEFQCSYCRQRGIILFQSEDEISLLMLRMPAKNRFAIQEARCCSNCDLFHFESGRQGKRSTGYCRAANQCVQAFNTCKIWMPRDSNRYESNIKQHVTNLGFGVGDRRNTSRNDIRDTIYTKEDHELERKRSERARIVYEHAYMKTMDDLRLLAEKVPLATGSMDEVEQWKKILDDPC